MFVHGVGFHEENKVLAKWVPAWSRAIDNAVDQIGVELQFDNPFGPAQKPSPDKSDPGILFYEDLIKNHKAPSGPEYLAAVTSLLTSYLTTKVGSLFHRDRGLLIDDEMKWKAREVAAWAHDDKLRTDLRKKVVAEIKAKKPDVVIAHSYGGLITYDACLFEDPDLLKDCYFVTLGTQIGNPLLRREFGGRQLPVKCKHWFNLYNPGDPVFVAPLDHIRADNFTHIVVEHPNGHDGVSYLGHPITADRVWRNISQGKEWLARSLEIRTLHANSVRPPVHRALLVGIDDYAHAEIPALKGCVNDTYLLSAALQESGIEHTSIRLLHNARATRSSLLDQLAWLLEDIREGDHRFFSFSGHGHRMATCDASGTPNAMEEILVTHDYAFTQTTGLRDRDFQDLYADLPNKAHFLIFLDCCHSGGMTRSSGPLVRSFAGPSDVEHPCVKWDASLQMWHQVGLAGNKGLNPEFLPPTYKTPALREEEKALYYGSDGDLRRIGRATQLRDIPHDKYDAIVARLKTSHPKTETGGPYLPLVYMACGETEKACEYIHGSVSYGAFTFAMVQALRDSAAGKPNTLTYGQLLKAASTKLSQIGFLQQPSILAQKDQSNAVTPFGKSGKSGKKAKPAPKK